MTEEQEKNKEFHKRFLQRIKASNINYKNTDDKKGFIKNVLKDYPPEHIERIKFERRIENGL